MAEPEKLGKELFRLVQYPQGRSFVSDGMDDWPDEDVLEVTASVFLPYAKRTVQVLRDFLKRHGREQSSPTRKRQRAKKRPV